MNDKQQQMHHVTLHKEKKPWYKRVWVWVLIIFVLIALGGAASGGSDTPETDNSGQSKDAPAAEKKSEEPAKKEWDVEAAYAKVKNGMTKQQVEAATGKKSDDCSESDMGEYGKSETCTYGNPFIDKGSIIVTYTNDEVSTKTKSTY